MIDVIFLITKNVIFICTSPDDITSVRILVLRMVEWYNTIKALLSNRYCKANV